MNWQGVATGLISFLIIGILHPVVIKAEYLWSKKIWPVFLLLGIICNVISLNINNIYASVVLAILGFSLFWSIGELHHQEERVKKGWFPQNPNKK